MVRREGTRFGVWTGHSLRRSVQSQKAVHSSQNIVVRASTDVKVKRAQKQASSVVENHLQNRSLNLKGFSNETVLPFSLNKNKRWEVVDALKKDVGTLCCQGDRITVSEHHINIGNPEVDCTASYDSMSKFSPKKTYARAADLAPKETEPSTDQVAAQDKEFGTKNRRRRQKRKVKVDKVTGVQEEVFSVNVSYAVNVAPPKHTLHTFHRRNRTNGLDVGNGENIALQVTKQGTKKRNKKVSGSILDDLDSVGEYDAVEYYYDEEDDQEVMDEFRCIPRSEVTAVFGMFVVDTDRQTAGFNQKRKNPSPSPRTKEHIFQIDLEEPQESGETPLEVEDNAILTFPVSTDNIQPAYLKGTFSDDYQEAYSCPRRFSVNITNRVIRKVRVIPKHGSNLSDMLLSTGNQVFVIFCMPVQDSSQHENISATVVGDRFNQMDAEKILYGYQGEIGCVSDAVDRIAEVIATKVKFRSYKDKLSISQKKKSRGVPLTTVADSLKWESETWSQQRMWKRIIAHEDDKREEESRIKEEIPEDHAETCKICYVDISEACPGTYLQPCNHLFCDGCWKHYLIAKVTQGDPRIACPEFNCKVPVDRVIVMSLVPSKIASFHLQQKINAAVASDKYFQWCPNKGCQCMARFAPVASGPLTISCECGSVWCSKCMQEAHWPATCAEAATYRADKAYVLTCVASGFNEILVDNVRFKNCPECNNSIEKFAGCNVVTCPCQCTFCWRCGDLDSNHNIYLCKQAAVDYETFEFNEEPMEHVYELSIMHHFKRSGIYSFKRNQLAHQLANKVAITFTLDNGPGHCDRQATESASAKALTFSVLRGKESGVKLLEEINNLFKKASDFLLEAYSVLEFLEIHLVSFPPCEQKRELYQRKTRLAFISQQLDDILNQRIGDAKGCVERVNMLYENGKSCLFSLPRRTSELSNMRETPINHNYRE
ncbi:uncharacterized protein LOC129257452 [Lytechinus pictus]|uniref:uncharacterized protein LOC129257452 n=1 Tax=Lytechinus pictus TaxID=7653 RepID=UPI0030BA005D